MFTCTNLLPLSEILGCFVYVVSVLTLLRVSFVQSSLNSLMTLTEPCWQLKKKGQLVRVNNSTHHVYVF